MGNFWLKIKVWTKVTLVSAACLYALLFIWRNSSQSATFWFWFTKPPYETSLLLLVVCTFISGIIAAIMVRTSFKTMRQIKELRARSRSERLEREVADMKDKASRLQTKPVTSDSALVPPPDEVA